jgi:hypothetical protein
MAGSTTVTIKICSLKGVVEVPVQPAQPVPEVIATAAERLGLAATWGQEVVLLNMAKSDKPLSKEETVESSGLAVEGAQAFLVVRDCRQYCYATNLCSSYFLNEQGTFDSGPRLDRDNDGLLTRLDDETYKWTVNGNPIMDLFKFQTRVSKLMVWIPTRDVVRYTQERAEEYAHVFDFLELPNPYEKSSSDLA